jgi:hypothetical protein
MPFPPQIRSAPLAVVVAEISSMMTREEASGRPLQFMVMKLKSRCSILFHLKVPGGKCATVISSPVSLANLASSTFYALIRWPLDPPASAQMSSRVAFE